MTPIGGGMRSESEMLGLESTSRGTRTSIFQMQASAALAKLVRPVLVLDARRGPTGPRRAYLSRKEARPCCGEYCCSAP